MLKIVFFWFSFHKLDIFLAINHTITDYISRPQGAPSITRRSSALQLQLAISLEWRFLTQGTAPRFDRSEKWRGKVLATSKSLSSCHQRWLMCRVYVSNLHPINRISDTRTPREKSLGDRTQRPRARKWLSRARWFIAGATHSREFCSFALFPRRADACVSRPTVNDDCWRWLLANETKHSARPSWTFYCRTKWTSWKIAAIPNAGCSHVPGNMWRVRRSWRVNVLLSQILM